MSTAKLFVEKGRKIGIEQGMKQGMKQGTEQGIEQEAERKNYVFVRNLLLANEFTITQIAGFANVTEEFVQKVKETM